MDAEREMIITELNSHHAKIFMDHQTLRIAKNKAFSIQERIDAAEVFKTLHNVKTHAHLWGIYSCSIGYSPSNEKEELALGYEGRSSLFLHIYKYKECLNDIDMGLKFTKSNSLKVKLLCRKAVCLAALNDSEKINAFEKAKFWFRKIKDEKNKSLLMTLINKTCETIEREDIDTIKCSKTEILQDLSLYENENITKSIEIRYDKKYGRHLVAARNIKPGEIICAQKPYVMTSNTEFVPHVYCCHCLKVSWNSIPCINCGWAFFCSEKCRNEAWQQYHDIECSVMPHVRNHLECEYWRQLTIRTVIIAVREAGSIAKLQAELKEIDRCNDKLTKGFSEDGRFEGDKFRSIYSLSNRWSPNIVMHTRDAVKILIAFIKHSKFLGTEKKFKSTSDILLDEDALFIGSLILRLFTVYSINYQEILEENPRCELGHNPNLCWGKRCCYRGTTVSPLLSLINHNCNPNTAILFTDSSRVIVYALKSIKENDQIFQSYSGCGFFHERSKADRLSMTIKNYNFKCDCKCCEEDWPILPKTNLLFNEMMLSSINESDKMTPGMMRKIQDLIPSKNHKKVRYSRKTIEELGRAIEAATNNYVEPSQAVCSLVNALMTAYKKVYLTTVHITSRCNNL